MSAVVHHPFQQITIDVPIEDYPRDSLFLPDSPSWATTLISQHAFMSFPQKVPCDIAPCETEPEPVEPFRKIIAEIFDRTTLSTHFDLSCLDGLDSQLLVYPIDSFAEECWSTVIDDLDAGPSTPTLSSHHLPSDEEDDIHSDSDETIAEEFEELMTPISPQVVMSDEHLYEALYKAVYTPESLNDFEYDRRSFIVFDPPITFAKPDEAVNFFPTSPPPPQRATLSSRFANFCHRTLRTSAT